MFGQQVAYNLVVNGREVFNDVAMKDVAVAFNPGVGLVQGAVGAFADAASVAGGWGMKRLSQIGSMTRQRAWWTTRSRKGAALTRRRFGS